MTSVDPPETAERLSRVLRLYHGTDQAGASNLLLHGVDQAAAASWGSSGLRLTPTERTGSRGRIPTVRRRHALNSISRMWCYKPSSTLLHRGQHGTDRAIMS